MAVTIASWSDSGDVVTGGGRRWHVERIQNGWARVEDREFSTVSLVSPVSGRTVSGPTVPDGITAEIVRRWGPL